MLLNPILSSSISKFSLYSQKIKGDWKFYKYPPPHHGPCNGLVEFFPILFQTLETLQRLNLTLEFLVH